MHTRTHRNRFLAAAVTAIVLVSMPVKATSKTEKEIDRSKLSQIQVGVTTREQVEQLLGKPFSRFPHGDLVSLMYGIPKVTEPRAEHAAETVSTIVSPISSLFMPSNYAVHNRMVTIDTASDGLVVQVCTVIQDYKARFAVIGGSSMEGGREVTPEEAARIKVNETTRDEVEALLGTPQAACESQYTPEEVARIKANKTKQEKAMEAKMTEAFHAHEFYNGFYWGYIHYAGKISETETFVVYFGPDGKVTCIADYKEGSQ